MLYDTASLAELSSLFLLVQIPSLLKGAPSQSLVPQDSRQLSQLHVGSGDPRPHPHAYGGKFVTC